MAVIDHPDGAILAVRVPRASHDQRPVFLGGCRAYGDRSEKVRNRGHFFAN